MNYAAFLYFLNKYKWVIIGIIITIVIIIVLRRNWYKVQHLLHPRDINFETGENLQISEQRKDIIENLAQKLYKDLYDTSVAGGHNTDLYKQALALTDNELLYLSRFYKRYVTNGNTLYEDIDDDYFPLTDVNTKLMAKLAKIGEA